MTYEQAVRFVKLWLIAVGVTLVLAYALTPRPAHARLFALEHHTHDTDGEGGCWYYCVSLPFPCYIGGKWVTCWITQCDCV